MKKTEEDIILKSYLRSLMRQLKSLKKALDSNDIADARIIVGELIEDTQKNIED